MRNIQGKGSFVMDRGNEVMREALETQIKANLAEVCTAAHAAGMPVADLHDLLDDVYDDIIKEQS